MMADTPVFRAKDFEQRVNPLMNVLEVIPKLPSAIRAMLV
jgi:hypothetical protein